jgi:hypothetical protein
MIGAAAGRDGVTARCHAIEEAYEFMLAYAAQGVGGEPDSQPGTQIREFLTRASVALDGLADGYRALVEGEVLTPADRYAAFLVVLDRDAHDALAAVQLVLAQGSISSQLVDNLNASIHVRALLTDLFLIDEVLKNAPTPSA